MISRRDSLKLGAALAALGALPAGATGLGDAFELDLGDAKPFSRDALRAMAKALSQTDYQKPPMVPQGWQDLSYEQYRSIWFDSRHALWRDTDRPARLEFFPAGLYFPNAIEVHVVEGDTARPVMFDLAAFDRTDQFPDLPSEGMGYSGIRVRGPIEGKGHLSEYAVFQGASYFRAIGKGQTYGLSARGLALGTGDEAGEEFPEFRAFWVEAPEAGSDEMIIHALLDGPSVAGAYHFRIQPGDETVMDVEAELFPRVSLTHVGIGAGTSMFLFDETNRSRFDDFRSAVHDSDGLLVQNGNGEVLWRPLANPVRLERSFFVDENPRGFGLMQRSRRPEQFADLSAKYHNRPCLWVEPQGDWGRGSVMLVEIPADKEIYDNIVAYWRPREPLTKGDMHSFTYRLRWGADPATTNPVARVTNTRMGQRVFEDGRIAAIDFEPNPAFEGDLSEIGVHVSSNRGKVSEGILHRNPATGGVRLDFTYLPGDARSMELRAQLRKDGRNLSEVWLYRWTRA